VKRKNVHSKGLARFGWQRVHRVLELEQSEVQRERLQSVVREPREWSPSEVSAQTNPAISRGSVSDT